MAEASPVSVRSSDSGYSSNSCNSCDLPSSSYDGTHLHWKSFRQHVLEPHRIRILDSAPKDCIPDAFLAFIEAGIQDTSRFESQKAIFRSQVAVGRGFGPSPVFPPNLLPPVSKDQGLARCMLPSFSREALPTRLNNHSGPLYELSVPRSNLGCGFSASAFSAEELQSLPSFLIPTGTTINFETGYISPGAAIYAPFLTFERAHGVKEHRLEAANNQCAIGGAWCVRAMHLLQARAYLSDGLRHTSIAFSCALDNTFAIINIHWVDESQTYCMSPLCKFDLNNDDHFTKFLVWVDSIGRWAMRFILPGIKTALQVLMLREPTPPPTPEEHPIVLTINTNRSPEELILRSLKTTFDDVPWKFEEEDCTAGTSSTASWGSPMTTDIHFIYPIRRDTSEIDSKSSVSGHTSKSSSSGKTVTLPRSPTAASQQLPTPDLVVYKRLSYALDEIRDLQQQLHILKTNFHNATNATTNELGAVKVTLASMLRKETLISRNRSLSVGNGSGLGLNLASSTEIWHAGQAHILPSPPRSVFVADCSSPISTLPSTASSTLTRSDSAPQLSPRPSPLTLFQSNISPPTTSVPPNAPSLPSLPSPEPSPALSSVPVTSRTLIPPTPFTPYMVVPPPPPEQSSQSLIKWSAMAFGAHMAASFIPIMSVRIVVLGAITEVALLAIASPHYATSWEWMMEVVRRR